MPRNFKVPEKMEWQSIRLNDPRVLMRLLIGILLAANLIVAVIAFKPFGGSADDLRQTQQKLNQQLQQAHTKLESSKLLVENINTARTQGDEFIAKYFMDSRTMAEITVAEMSKDASDSAVRPLPASFKVDPVEGSDNLKTVVITQGFEGTYTNLAKLVNLLEKSPRFFILDTMALNAPQQNTQQTGTQLVNVSITVIAYERDLEVAQP